MAPVIKKRYAIYYWEDSNRAKVRANVLRGESHQVIVLDAHAFKDIEQVDFVEFIDVPDYVQKTINDGYAGMVRESSPADPAPTKIEVPSNWRKMSWTQMQALAAEIAPDETVRTKDDAKRIIADYVEDNED